MGLGRSAALILAPGHCYGNILVGHFSPLHGWAEKMLLQWLHFFALYTAVKFANLQQQTQSTPG